MMLLHRAVAVILLLTCSYAINARAQCPVPEDDDSPPELATAVGTILQAQGDEQLLPETGFLSDSRYTSVFFGLALDLPAPADQRIMLPLMPHGQHALLALSFKNGDRESSITVTASEPSNPVPQMTESERQKAFQAWVNHQPQLHHDMPDWMMRSGHFYHTETHVGRKYGVLYWTKIKNYKLHFEIVSNDREFVNKAKRAMEAITVYCPQNDGTLTTKEGNVVLPEGEPYDGPTIPTAHVDARLSEKPEEHEIAAGIVNGGNYQNPDLGFEYAIPTGWKVLNPESGVAESQVPANAVAQRTSEFLQACSRRLLQLAKNPSGTATSSTMTISLRALDPTCLSVRGPDTMRDRRGAEELAAYLEMLGNYGHIQSTDLMTVSNHLFAVYRGTIGERNATGELASRASEVIFVTRHRKMLLLWTLVAPKEIGLTEIPATSVRFESTDILRLGPELFQKK